MEQLFKPLMTKVIEDRRYLPLLVDTARDEVHGPLIDVLVECTYRVTG